MQEEFQKAVAEAKDIPDSIDHMDKLALYGLFKAATVGKCNIGACFSYSVPSTPRTAFTRSPGEFTMPTFRVTSG
jgi:hypothetical protein